MTEEKTLATFETYLFGIKGNKEGFLKVPTENYELTNERLKISKQGLMTATKIDIELYRVEDISVSQKFKDKALGVGDILIKEANGNETTLKRIKNPHEIREQIRNAAKEAKEKVGVSYRSNL